MQQAVVELMRRAVVCLPKDVKAALKRAEKAEKGLAKEQMKIILENMALVEKRGVPVCQDTGIPLFYARVGRKFKLDFDLERVVARAVEKATKEIPLRPNVVEPFTRKNSGTNVGLEMPHINFSFFDGNYLELTYLPKGGGSENMSMFRMLKPVDGIEGIKRFVLESVVEIGGKPCPPYILGIGIGGSSDMAMGMAKRASFRELGRRNRNPDVAALEAELLKKINSLGIGPMGLGGRTSVLGVNIEFAGCHTASLPVALNVMCWAARRASLRAYNNGEFRFG